MGSKQIKPEWVTWLRNTIDLLNDDGIMAFPLRGVVYKVDKAARTLTTIVEVPGVFDRQNDTAVTTDGCAEALGYQVIYLDNPARTMDDVNNLVTSGNTLISDEVLETLGQVYEQEQKVQDRFKWPKR